MGELGDTAFAAHHAIGELVGDLGIDTLVTLGTTQEIAALAAGAFLSNQPPRSESVDDPEGLLPLLNDLLTAGDVVFVKASRFVGLEHFGDTLLRIPARSSRYRRWPSRIASPKPRPSASHSVSCGRWRRWFAMATYLPPWSRDEWGTTGVIRELNLAHFKPIRNTTSAEKRDEMLLDPDGYHKRAQIESHAAAVADTQVSLELMRRKRRRTFCADQLRPAGEEAVNADMRRQRDMVLLFDALGGKVKALSPSDTAYPHRSAVDSVQIYTWDGGNSSGVTAVQNSLMLPPADRDQVFRRTLQVLPETVELDVHVHLARRHH